MLIKAFLNDAFVVTDLQINIYQFETESKVLNNGSLIVNENSMPQFVSVNGDVKWHKVALGNENFIPHKTEMRY